MILFNLAVIFQKFSIHPQHTITFSYTNNISDTLLQTRYFTSQIPPIFANIKNVNEIKELVSLFKNQTLDSPKLIIFHKLLKLARYAMVDMVILNHTNTELLTAYMQKNDEFNVLVFNTGVKVLKF